MSTWVPTPDMVPALVDVRSKITASKRFILAWLAVVWFDTLATVPDERLLWNSRPSLLKLTFLVNRWISPCLQSLWAALVFATIPSNVCADIFWLQPASITAVMAMCSVLMAIRVYPLYSTRMILTLLVAMVTLEVVAMSTAASRFHRLELPPNFGKVVELQGCIATGPNGHANSLVAVFWAAPLCFDTAIVALTVYNILVVNKRARRLPVLSHILRDGVFFFLCISVANLVNVALYAETDVVIQNFNNPTSVALASIMSSRLVTSLRKLDCSEQQRRRMATATTTWTGTTSIATASSQVQSHGNVLEPWCPPAPSRPFDPSSSVPGKFDHRQRNDELDDEERAAQRDRDEEEDEDVIEDASRERGGGGGGDEKHTNQAIVGLERLGLISSPSTALDISRPVAPENDDGTGAKAPFSDVIPAVAFKHRLQRDAFASSPSSCWTRFPFLHHRPNMPTTTDRDNNRETTTRSTSRLGPPLSDGPRKGKGEGIGATTPSSGQYRGERGGGFGIKVERETFITVAAQP
ncbi:hypothetical protein JCM3766R1_003188 [Sporobolomyces carnicolor]